MPYLAVILPQVPQDKKDEFLAMWPKIAAEIKALPMVKGVSGGPIIVKDGVEIKEFEFIYTIAFDSKDGKNQFLASDWFKEAEKKRTEHGAPVPLHSSFQCEDFPEGAAKKYASFSRITLDDPSKGEEAAKAIAELNAISGKQSWGGKTDDAAGNVGMGITGWDSREEFEKVIKLPGAEAAWKKYNSFGKVQDAVIELTVY